MKTRVILIATFTTILLLVFLNSTNKKSAKKNNIIVENGINDINEIEGKIERPEDKEFDSVKNEIDETDLEYDDDFSESAECKDFKNKNALRYREYQELFDQIGLNQEELGNETAFNTLSEKSLNDLAISGNHKAKYILGITYIWQGGLGIDYFAMGKEQNETEEEKELRFERIRNHQLDLEQVLKGQELLFDASANGRYFGLVELFNGQKFVINKLSKQKDKTELKSELLKYLAIVELIDYVFEQDSKQLMLSDIYYRKDKAVEAILNNYKEYLEPLQIDSEELIKESDGSGLIERWKQFRLNAGYLETKFNLEDRISSFAKQLRNVCGIWS